jgi:hypothetical protein
VVRPWGCHPIDPQSNPADLIKIFHPKIFTGLGPRGGLRAGPVAPAKWPPKVYSNQYPIHQYQVSNDDRLFMEYSMEYSFFNIFLKIKVDPGHWT